MKIEQNLHMFKVLQKEKQTETNPYFLSENADFVAMMLGFFSSEIHYF
jgi:hypothetical protein